MTSLSPGASREVPATPRLCNAPPARLGGPELRWRRQGNPLGRALLSVFFALARPLIVWQQRLRDRAILQRLPDRMLRDIGLEPHEAQAEADKPFWRA